MLKIPRAKWVWKVEPKTEDEDDLGSGYIADVESGIEIMPQELVNSHNQLAEAFENLQELFNTLKSD